MVFGGAVVISWFRESSSESVRGFASVVVRKLRKIAIEAVRNFIVSAMQLARWFDVDYGLVGAALGSGVLGDGGACSRIRAVGYCSGSSLEGAECFGAS